MFTKHFNLLHVSCYKVDSCEINLVFPSKFKDKYNVIKGKAML